MFKKLAIAAACSIALYGVAKLIRRHIRLVHGGQHPAANEELPGTGVDAEAPQNGEPIGDSADPITREKAVDEAASDQGSDAGGDAAADDAAAPAAVGTCP